MLDGVVTTYGVYTVTHVAQESGCPYDLAALWLKVKIFKNGKQRLTFRNRKVSHEPFFPVFILVLFLSIMAVLFVGQRF